MSDVWVSVILDIWVVGALGNTHVVEEEEEEGGVVGWSGGGEADHTERDGAV